MALSPQQRAALFEKMKSFKPASPSTTQEDLLKPKIAKMPEMPKAPKIAQPKDMYNNKSSDQVDENFIGRARPQRFTKIKKMFGG